MGETNSRVNRAIFYLFSNSENFSFKIKQILCVDFSAYLVNAQYFQYNYVLRIDHNSVEHRRIFQNIEREDIYGIFNQCYLEGNCRGITMISLRLMEDTIEDYTAMRNWFLEPELQEWVWCDEKGEPPVPLERVVEKYGPRVKNPTDVFPYFILRDGEPIGFIQYYIQDETTIGLDMWIGVSKERNHGYGTEALKQMVQLIHRKHPSVKEVFIDPEEANVRAVKCYQKAGFQYAGEMMDDGYRCLLLKINFEETSYGD